MTLPPARDYEVRIVEGAPHGDLYELETTYTYHVVDTGTGEIVMTFVGEMSASLSRDTGLWDDAQYDGVCEVMILPGGRAVVVRYYNGREETLPLP